MSDSTDKYLQADVEEGTPLKDVLAYIRNSLSPKYGMGEAREMSRIIFENLKGWSAVDLAIKANEKISDFIAGKVKNVVQRLLNDEPIQLIFGIADFYGLKLKVTPDTLIPRPETAELVDIIVKENPGKDMRVLDCGTGSGCIAIALCRNLLFPDITAIDISDKALAVARENGRTLRCNVNFLHADILRLPESLPESDTRSPFNIIVSNPPYVTESEKATMERNVLDHEPASALFVPDSSPLEFYLPILRSAADGLLAPGGKIYFEINPLFAAQLRDEAVKTGFNNVTIIRDTEGKQRFLKIES